MVEVVDAQGVVTGTVTRAEMRRDRLRHRCTYVAVLTSELNLVVHQRADWKDTLAGYWDLCFGGVAGVGEQWEDAARRELAEEAGLVREAGTIDTAGRDEETGSVGTSGKAQAGLELHLLGRIDYESPEMSVIGEAFFVRTDETPTCPDGEVVALDLVPLAEAEAWAGKRDVCGDSHEAVLPLLLAYFAEDLKSL